MSHDDPTGEGKQEDVGEVDVWLSQNDIDHLQDGQPVFKAGSGDTRIVLRAESDVYVEE